MVFSHYDALTDPKTGGAEEASQKNRSGSQIQTVLDRNVTSLEKGGLNMKGQTQGGDCAFDQPSLANKSVINLTLNKAIARKEVFKTNGERFTKRALLLQPVRSVMSTTSIEPVLQKQSSPSQNCHGGVKVSRPSEHDYSVPQRASKQSKAKQLKNKATSSNTQFTEVGSANYGSFSNEKLSRDLVHLQIYSATKYMEKTRSGFSNGQTLERSPNATAIQDDIVNTYDVDLLNQILKERDQPGTPAEPAQIM